MRRLVVAIFVVVLAFGLVGCGGGAEEPAPTTPAQAPVTPAPVDPNAPVIEDTSPQIGEVFELLPSENSLPSSIKKRLESKQAMVVVFYDGKQLEADDVRSQVTRAVRDNSGMADLIEINLAKYRASETTPTQVKTDIQSDEEAKLAQGFAREIGVDVTPFVIVIDRQGYIIFKWRGVIDRELMARQVERVG